MKLEIKHLSFSYDGKRKILNDISLSFREGEFIAILGRNGAGKTTLFKTLLGLLKTKEGEVFVDEQPFLSLSARERAKCIAYIPQESHPSFSYSVLTSVLMGTTNMVSTLASPGAGEVERAMEALKKFHIDHLARRNVNSLSGGERQLVLCARAIAQNARILLFDEPTSNLDWANQIKTLENIKALTSEGYLAIVSTHNLEQALNYADRLVLLGGGKINADATAKEIASSSLLSTFYEIPVEVEEYRGRYICIPREVP